MVDDRPRQCFTGATSGFEKVLEITKRNVQNAKQKAPEILPEMRFALCFEKRQTSGNDLRKRIARDIPQFPEKNA